MKKVLIACVAMVAAQALAAAPPPAPPTSPENMTAQQLFNAATQAVSENRCRDALPLMDALLARPAITGNARVLATVKLRRSRCLVAAGRFEEARADIGSAFAVVQPNDSVLAVDISEAHLSLGKMYFLDFDFESATLEFERANALLQPDERLETLKWLAMSTMFEPGDRSLGYAAQMLTLAGQLTGDLKKEVSANARTLHARALMIHGQNAAAYAELKQAVADQGGLTERVDLADVITRSDLALAALLNNDQSSARKYMAYTGAGRFEKAPLHFAQEMAPPMCGGAADLKLDDMAIIQFTIDDEGHVANVMPVYASHTGPMATEFARAVTGWSWRAEDAKKIPAFFRNAMRVEIRCTNASWHPDVTDILQKEYRQFLAEKHPDMPSGKGLTRDEELGWYDSARAVLEKAGAPLAALTWLDVQRSQWRSGFKLDYKKQRAELRTLLEHPDVAADHTVAGALKLLIAEPHYGLPSPPDAESLLTSVANDTALAEHDPLRTGAWLRLATLQSGNGNLSAARSSYTQSGVTAQECSMVDATPVLRRRIDSTLDFPDEALRWGFEGFVVAEFDIRPDGTTASQRAVVAYPPLIFGDPTVAGLKRVHYTQTYRPEGGLGCGGKQFRINYDITRHS